MGVRKKKGKTKDEAKALVASEFPTECGACALASSTGKPTGKPTRKPTRKAGLVCDANTFDNSENKCERCSELQPPCDNCVCGDFTVGVQESCKAACLSAQPTGKPTGKPTSLIATKDVDTGSCTPKPGKTPWKAHCDKATSQATCTCAGTSAAPYCEWASAGAGKISQGKPTTPREVNTKKAAKDKADKGKEKGEKATKAAGSTQKKAAEKKQKEEKAKKAAELRTKK